MRWTGSSEAAAREDKVTGINRLHALIDAAAARKDKVNKINRFHTSGEVALELISGYSNTADY